MGYCIKHNFGFAGFECPKCYIETKSKLRGFVEKTCGISCVTRSDEPCPESKQGCVYWDVGNGCAFKHKE